MAEFERVNGRLIRKPTAQTGQARFQATVQRERKKLEIRQLKGEAAKADNFFVKNKNQFASVTQQKAQLAKIPANVRTYMKTTERSIEAEQKGRIEKLNTRISFLDKKLQKDLEKADRKGKTAERAKIVEFRDKLQKGEIIETGKILKFASDYGSAVEKRRKQKDRAKEEREKLKTRGVVTGVKKTGLVTPKTRGVVKGAKKVISGEPVKVKLNLTKLPQFKKETTTLKNILQISKVGEERALSKIIDENIKSGKIVGGKFAVNVDGKSVTVPIKTTAAKKAAELKLRELDLKIKESITSNLRDSQRTPEYKALTKQTVTPTDLKKIERNVKYYNEKQFKEQLKQFRDAPKNVGLAAYEFGKDIVVMPVNVVNAAYKYGVTASARANEKGESVLKVFGRDAKSIGTTSAKVTKFVVNNPVQSFAIASGVAAQLGRSNKKAFLENPVKYSTRLMLEVFSGKVLLGAAKGVKSGVKVIRDIPTITKSVVLSGGKKLDNSLKFAKNLAKTRTNYKKTLVESLVIVSELDGPSAKTYKNLLEGLNIKRLERIIKNKGLIKKTQEKVKFIKLPKPTFEKLPKAAKESLLSKIDREWTILKAKLKVSGIKKDFAKKRKLIAEVLTTTETKSVKKINEKVEILNEFSVNKLRQIVKKLQQPSKRSAKEIFADFIKIRKEKVVAKVTKIPKLIKNKLLKLKGEPTKQKLVKDLILKETAKGNLKTLQAQSNYFDIVIKLETKKIKELIKRGQTSTSLIKRIVSKIKLPKRVIKIKAGVPQKKKELIQSLVASADIKKIAVEDEYIKLLSKLDTSRLKSLVKSKTKSKSLLTRLKEKLLQKQKLKVIVEAKKQRPELFSGVRKYINLKTKKITKVPTELKKEVTTSRGLVQVLKKETAVITKAKPLFKIGKAQKISLFVNSIFRLERIIEVARDLRNNAPNATLRKQYNNLIDRAKSEIAKINKDKGKQEIENKKKPDTITKPDTALKGKTDVGQRKVSKQKTKTQLKLRTITKPKPITPTKPKKLRLPKLKIGERLPAGQRLKFDARYKEGGRIKTLSLGLPLNKALKRVANLADQTTQRSIEIFVVGTTKAKDIGKPTVLNKFRPRVSANKKVLKLVEKTKNAIDTKGEKENLSIAKKLKSKKKKTSVRKRKK